MKITFEKEESGRWYVVLPEWTGEHSDLEMVMGADEMLDELSDGNNTVTIDVSTEDPGNDCILFNITSHDDDGADYVTSDKRIKTHMIWLCNVMHYVFDGEHPERLYITVQK